MKDTKLTIFAGVNGAGKSTLSLAYGDIKIKFNI